MTLMIAIFACSMQSCTCRSASLAWRRHECSSVGAPRCRGGHVLFNDTRSAISHQGRSHSVDTHSSISVRPDLHVATVLPTFL